MLFRNIKRRFSAYLSPVISISRKVTRDKRVVTNFRHLNVGIGKNYNIWGILYSLRIGKYV